jgi:hypothetical protein
MASLRLPPGPQIGDLKTIAQEAYLEGRVKTKKEALELLHKVVGRGRT